MTFSVTRAAVRHCFSAFVVASLTVAGSVTAEALPLEITTTSLPGAIAGVGYSDGVVATSGTTPYTWSLESGTLPGGITLDSGTGALTGTATAAGSNAFIVRVEDALGDTATRALSLTVDHASAAQLAFEQQPGAIVAGVSFGPEVAVSVRDEFGNLVTDATDTITLELTSGTGSLVGTASQNASDGVAIFPGLSVEVAGTGKQLTASSGSLTSVTSDPFAVSAAAAATLTIEQQPSATVAGATMSPAVTVRVRDAFGNGVAGEPVALGLVGTGTLTGGAAVASDGTGLATFAGLSVDVAGAGKQLTASSGALTPVSSDPFAVTAAAAASLTFMQQPSATVAGATMSPAVTVRVRDAFGNDVAGESVSLALLGTGTLTGGDAVASDGTGLATFAGLSVDVAGAGKQLTASSGALTPVSSDPFAVSAASAATLTIEQQPSATVAGATMSPAVTVRVRDAFGNGVAGESVSLALMGTGTLTGGAAVASDGTGLATFAWLSVDVAGAGKQLTASSGELSPVSSDPFAVTAAAAATLTIEQQPSATVAGATMSPAVTVRVRDAFGNGVAGELVAMALVGTGTLTGGDAVASDGTGLATFAGLSVDVAGAGKQLTASSGALTPVSSDPFAVTAAAAATLTIEQQPSATVAGATMSPAVTVRVRDAFGNGVAGESVSLALMGTGTLTGGGAVASDGTGLATFAGLSVDVAGAGKQLTASSGELSPVSSDPFAITAAAAASLTFEQQPSATVAGAAMTPAVTVRVRDALGNGVAGESVSLALMGTGTLTGGGAVASDGTGLATFAGLSVDVAGAGKQLTASSGALTPVSSDPFAVTAAAAATLTIEQQPSATVAGATMSPAVTVRVRDAFGNGVAGEPVALALVGTGTLTGGAAVASDGTGLATFAGLSVDIAGAGKQLTASSGALTPASSDPFAVTAAAAATLTIEQQPSATVAGAAMTPAVTVRVRDALGNGVAGESVSLALMGTGTLTGGDAVASDGTGLATFAGLSVDVAGAGKQLTASGGALTPVSSDPFAVTAAAAATLTIEQQPSATVAGATMSPAVTVRVRDAFGNGVAGEPVALALVGTGTLTGGAAVASDGTGLAIFAGLSVDVAGAGKQLTASSGALTPASSDPFAVTAAAAAILTIEQQPSATVAGATMSPAVTVRVRDAFGNGVAGESVSLALMGTGTLTGGAAVASDGAGLATFAGLSVDVAGAGKQLTASSGALTPVSSDPFAVSAAAAASLTFEQQPSYVTAGATMTPAVTVRVRDAFGNGVAGESVSLALMGTGTLTGGAAVASDGAGLATFAGLSVDVAGAGKQLTASSGALTPVSSDPFAVSTAGVASLTFEQQPTPALAGATLAPAVTIRVRDAFGNTVAGAPVTLALVGNGTLAGGAAVNSDGAGLATFAALSVNREGTKQVGATSGAVGPVLSGSFAISCPAVSVGPPSLPSGTSGTSYSATITASGGVAPYAFAVTSGGLPTGVSLDGGTGELSGTPTTVGSFAFTITAADADSCLGSKSYSVGVCPAIAVLPASPAPASVSVAYSQSFSASAGSAPFTFALTAGSLPPGLTLSAGGALSGTPTTAGSYSFTIGVTAAGGCSGSTAYLFNVLGIPAAVTTLAADRTVAGNDGDGTAKILVTFSMPPGGVTAKVYRAPFGGYPRYDDAGGVVPPTPAYPPSAPWTLTGVTSSGQTDEPATRDFYYYVVFVENAGGGRSGVSNKTTGTCNYALGDVSNGMVTGAGDNLVDDVDVSLLGTNYGIGASLIASRGVAYLDVGPTTDLLLTSRPFTDSRINFEDLIIFAGNYGLVSAPLLAKRADDEALRVATTSEEFAVEAPSLVSPGQAVTAVLKLKGSGRMQGFSVDLAWDPNVVEPLETTSGGYAEARQGVMMSPHPGTVDAALLGIRASGMTGEGEVARVSFRVLREGDAAIRLGQVTARDAANRPVAADAIGQASRPDVPAKTVLLSPWPNPARGNVTLAFGLASAGDVDLTLYSVDGRRVKTLASGPHEGGMFRVTWAGDDELHRVVAPGIYYARLSVAGRSFTRTLVHLR